MSNIKTLEVLSWMKRADCGRIRIVAQNMLIVTLESHEPPLSTGKYAIKYDGTWKIYSYGEVIEMLNIIFGVTNEK